MITILGLDVSSTCTGYGLLGVEGSTITIVEHGTIKPLKKDGYHIVERLDDIAKQVSVLCDRLKPDYCCIEESVQFMKGRTSANTIITLSVFNKAAALQAFRSIGKIPLLLLPVSIRSRIRKFLNLEKIEKEDIPDILKDFFGENAFKVVKYRKRGKNKGAPVSSAFDEADGCAAALAGLIELGLVK